MKHNRKIVFHDVGILLHVPGGMALFSVGVALLARESSAAVAFAMVSALSFGIGHGLRRSCISPDSDLIDSASAMATVAFAWLLAGILGSLPFWIVALLSTHGSEVSLAYSSPIGALFEGFSGFTSCGLTMSGRPDLLPVSLQWWRSLMEWIGGVGVVVLALSVSKTENEPHEMFEAEGRSRPHQDIRAVSIRIWKVYIGFTLATICALWGTGMPAWQALNHGLTAISTGGFSITSSGFGGYGSATMVVLIASMVLGATSFHLHATVWLDGDRHAWMRNTQFRWLGGGLVVGALLLIAVTRAEGGDVNGMYVVFQWVSALCTCGFSAVDLSTWSAVKLSLLMVAMMVGGSAGSTAGGLKLSRVARISKGMLRFVTSKLHVEDSLPKVMENGEVVELERARRQLRCAGSMLGLWICTLAVGSILLLILLPDENPYHVLFEAVSATGGVGLSTGVTQASMPSGAKLILVGLMWVGRLEIVAVLALIFQSKGRLLELFYVNAPMLHDK